MNWDNKKVLVTGTSGFIGSNLTRNLLNNGADIYSIDNFSYIDANIAKNKLTFLKDVNLIEKDVSTKEAWEQIPKNIDYIFHFAAPSSITLFNRDPKKCFNETYNGLYNALEFAKNNKNVKRVIYPSTGSLYAGNLPPHREDIKPEPRNSYAAAKVACEGLASSYADFVPITGLRIFAGYGPGEEWKKDFGSVLYLFIKDSLEGKAPIIFGSGNQTRDFVYIEDLIKIIMKSAEINHTGVVNVGRGVPVSFNNILGIIQNYLGKEIKPEFVAKERNYVENLKADTTLMKRLFDIEPISVEKAVPKFIDYLRASS